MIDPGTPSDRVIDSDHFLRAWKDGKIHADHLEAMIEPISAAAEIVRGPGQPAGLGVSRVPFLLPLFVDLDGIHRRQAWCAWTDEPEPQIGPLTTPTLKPAPAPEPTRGGRWTRLHRIGAQIRAVDDPADIDMYGAPRPIGVKQVPSPAGPGDNPRKPAWERFDPEDDEVKPRGPKAMLESLRRRRHPDADILQTVLGSTDKEPDHD